jgi:hypothetical protein
MRDPEQCDSELGGREVSSLAAEDSRRLRCFGQTGSLDEEQLSIRSPTLTHLIDPLKQQKARKRRVGGASEESLNGLHFCLCQRCGDIA